jgi:hypothetical protein
MRPMTPPLRYDNFYSERGGEMRPAKEGKFVLHSDYAALHELAENLARAFERDKAAYPTLWKYSPNLMGALCAYRVSHPSES